MMSPVNHRETDGGVLPDRLFALAVVVQSTVQVNALFSVRREIMGITKEYFFLGTHACPGARSTFRWTPGYPRSRRL